MLSKGSKTRWYLVLLVFTELLLSFHCNASEILPEGSVVRAVAKFPAPFGGVLYLVKKKNLVDKKSNEPKWCHFNALDPDPEGSPLWPIKLLGEASAFFGFLEIDDNYVVVPDTEALNAAIYRYNALAPEELKIRLNFYECAGIVDGDEYLKKLIESIDKGYLSLPRAKSGKLFFHDLNIHSTCFIASPLFWLRHKLLQSYSFVLSKCLKDSDVKNTSKFLIRNVDHFSGKIWTIIEDINCEIVKETSIRERMYASCMDETYQNFMCLNPFSFFDMKEDENDLLNQIFWTQLADKTQVESTILLGQERSYYESQISQFRSELIDFVITRFKSDLVLATSQITELADPFLKSFD